MPAARISSALVHRVATGIAGTGAAAVIEDGRGVKITIVANKDGVSVASDDPFDTVTWGKK
jgi:hypothetical protein